MMLGVSLRFRTTDAVPRLLLPWLSGFALAVFCPYAQAQAVACSSMSLDPVVEDPGNPAGRRILDAYYLETEAGCWVHPHPNGKDFVVTPPAWGANPTPVQRGWVELATKSITDAREVLSGIGRLESNLYVLVTDRTASELGRLGIAEAYWLLGNACWMELRQEALIGAGGPETGPEHFKFTLAHEIGHCFLMENVPNYVPATAWIYTVDWWDESGAEFLAAQIYPHVNIEHSRAGAFDLDGIRWLQPYRGYVVLQHYANTTSTQMVIELLEWFHEIGKVADRSDVEGLKRFFDAIYDHPSFGDFYHDFAITHYRSEVEDPGGGMTPREPYIDSRFAQRLAGDSGVVSIPAIPANRLILGEITIPAGYDARLTPPQGSPKRHYQTLLENGRYIEDWASDATVAGSCEYDTEARVFLTHHFETELAGLQISFGLEEKCACGGQEITQCCLKPRTSDLQPDHDHRPYYSGPDPIRAKAACMMACQDACWCRNKHMWSFEPVTKGECDTYYPGGTVAVAPGMPTMCQGMTHPERRRPPPAKKDVLDVHCGTLCSEQC